MGINPKPFIFKSVPFSVFFFTEYLTHNLAYFEQGANILPIQVKILLKETAQMQRSHKNGVFVNVLM